MGYNKIARGFFLTFP